MNFLGKVSIVTAILTPILTAYIAKKSSAKRKECSIKQKPLRNIKRSGFALIQEIRMLRFPF